MVKMIIFPDAIKVKITDSDTAKPVQNLAVFIKLFAKRKNDYYFLLPVSDQNGTIEITDDWLRREIRISANLFIMDYASSLEDCQPKFELIMLNDEAVKRAVKEMTSYKEYTSTSQEFIDAVSRVDNYKYIPISKVVELHGEKVVEVELKTKGIESS